MNSSVSRWKACRRFSSKPGKKPGIRLLGLDVPQVEPLLGEVVDQRARAAVGQHPLHLRLEHRRIAEGAVDGAVEQLVVRDAAPQEERQARGQLQVADAVGRAGRGVRRIALDAEEELGADEQPLEGALDAPVEAALGAALLVERQQQVEVGPGHRSAVGAAGQGREDLARARLGRGSRRCRGRQLKMRSRLGVSPAPSTPYGPLSDTVEIAGSRRCPRRDARTRLSWRAPVFCRKATAISRGPAPSGTRTSTGGSASNANTPLAPPHQRPPADAEEADPLTVDAHLNLVLLAGRLGELDGQDVLAVRGQMAADQRAAPRPERQPLQVAVLNQGRGRAGSDRRSAACSYRRRRAG